MIRPWEFLLALLIHICKSENLPQTIWKEVENHRAWINLSAVDCGNSAADRIIGGVNAALGQLPWIVRLGYTTDDADDEVDWMCGGALLTAWHVVTAAHCVSTGDSEYQLSFIRMGEYDTRTDPDCQMGMCAPKVQDRKIKAIRSHTKFNNPAFHNDIAIIVLDSPADMNGSHDHEFHEEEISTTLRHEQRRSRSRSEYNERGHYGGILGGIGTLHTSRSDYVAPICLPKQEQLFDLHLGELVTVAGWGKMNMSTDQRAHILQVVAIPIVQPTQCDIFGRGFKLDKSEICAGAQHNKDACGGDSGGPLMKVYDTVEGPKNFLVGVVSFGPTICGIKKPGVYVSISYFLKWILDNIVR